MRWAGSQADDRDAGVARVEAERAHGGDLSQPAVQRCANPSAALTVDQAQLGEVGQQRVIQRLLRPGKRLLDGEPVQIYFGGSNAAEALRKTRYTPCEHAWRGLWRRRRLLSSSRPFSALER